MRCPAWVAELVVAAPGLALALAVVVLLAGRAAGIAPFVEGRTVTLAEAAALEDEADMVRLLEAGADPNAASFVRRTRLRDVHRELTPLEAAAGTRHPSVVQRLLAAGASLDADTFGPVWCAASATGSAEVRALIETHRPAGVTPDCGAAASLGSRR